MKVKEENGLIEVVFDKSVGEQQKQIEQGRELKTRLEEIYRENLGKKFCILLDLTKPGLLIDATSLHAVGIYEEIVEMEQTAKMAVLGRPSFADPIIEVAFEKIAEKKASWFTERKKALWWLGVKED